MTANSWSQNRDLRYDEASRIATQKVGSTVNTYRYDLTDQLTNSAGSFTYSATYDTVGNRLTADGRTYTTNSVNQYTGLTSPTQTLLYDKNGNLTNWAGASFAHDSQGQLTSSSALTGDWKQYDYRRLRVEDGWDYQYAANYHYTYDARGNLLERWEDYEGGVEYAYADGIDQAVLMYYDDQYSGTPYALVTDHLGSVIAIFDDSGHMVETYDYTPFGKTTIRDASHNVISSSTLANILGFTGREMDGDYYYYRNRWYSPDLGRFLEPDPIGLRASDLNLYQYAFADPVNLVDRFGLNSLPATFWAALATGNLQTAALILEQMVDTGQATPAMQQALQLAQKVAELLPKITIPLDNLARAFRDGRLKCLTPDDAPNAIANAIARGNLQTWIQGGQTIFKGSFYFNNLPYYFTGRINAAGLYEVNDIVQAVSKR